MNPEEQKSIFKGVGGLGFSVITLSIEVPVFIPNPVLIIKAPTLPKENYFL